MEVLADLLRALRETAPPPGAPVRADGHRRPPGLRREEVAALAGLHPAYYARLEQGVERDPPDWVLAALARVFDLDAAGAERMYLLAHPPAGPTRLSQRVRWTVENWHTAPVFAVNRRLDVLAANGMARILFDGMDHTDNLMRHAFLAPAAQEFFPEWEREAGSKVAHLREAAAEAPAEAGRDRPELYELVDRLSSESADFQRMWSRQDVEADEYKRMYHHAVGEILLRHDTLTVRSAPGVLLYVCHAEPGTPSEEALTLLGILAAGETSPGRP
ncbi:helix-turn-helix domain-containing protein [Sphaerisporangium rhizosphaerae]|uniref:Helix-turn-helix domain-containing protein n=1 Tax=Sphaerisporangium rhizosphaerae TaxID=2269375 RepID=A0ABW2P070_9ACTN